MKRMWLHKPVKCAYKQTCAKYFSINTIGRQWTSHGQNQDRGNDSVNAGDALGKYHGKNVTNSITRGDTDDKTNWQERGYKRFRRWWPSQKILERRLSITVASKNRTVTKYVTRNVTDNVSDGDHFKILPDKSGWQNEVTNSAGRAIIMTISIWDYQNHWQSVSYEWKPTRRNYIELFAHGDAIIVILCINSVW